MFADLLTAGWQMDKLERIVLLHVVASLRPRVAIEIGTADGGSLSAIARHAERVFTLDTQTDRASVLGGHFTNVEFIPGRSQETLAPLLARLAAEGAEVDFVLVDGDHSTGAVRRDLEILLARYRPRERPLYVLMHDSFNPDCRAGIQAADWNANPHVRRVQLDYVPGVFPAAGVVARQMWGGFALAVLRPGARADGQPVDVRGNRQLVFDAVLPLSVHGTTAAAAE